MTDAQSEPKKTQKSWFLRHKLLSGLGAIVVLVIVIAALGTGGGGTAANTAGNTSAAASTQTTNGAPSTDPSSQAVKSPPSPQTKPTSPQIQPTRKTDPPPQTKPSAVANTRDNASAKLTTLGTGTFTVGPDVPVGRYAITAKAGESGNLSASSSDNPLAINAILGDAGGLGVPSVTSTLTKGETLTISGLSAVAFTPAPTKLRTSLSTGDWVVGLDIAAGRYVAKPAQGGSGNFTVYDKDGLPTTNEVLGVASGMGVPDVTVSLSDGDQIGISGLSGVTFTAK